MTVVAIGKSSFLARAMQESGRAGDWVFLSHEEALADVSWVERAGCVVNFAFPPGFKSGSYDPAMDIDTRLARLIADRPVHYIMLSSRKVYGTFAEPVGLTEDREPAPVDAYARAKLETERSLGLILRQERLTILRLSNVFGFEPGRGTFLGHALTSLGRKGEIVFDMGPETVRDFLSVERFAAALTAITDAPAAGVFNLGSGFGLACGKIVQWLIEGYGAGTLRVTDPALRDQFWLDMTKTRAAFQIPRTGEVEMKADCVALGRRVRAHGV